MTDLVGQKLGQYEITAIIGEGGMASVYRARQASIKRDVAVKVIKTALMSRTEFVRRFEREAQTAASLSHPHILKVFDFGEQADVVYIVMEMLTGGSLAQQLAKGPFFFERIAQLLEQIGGALDYAHEQGVVHRDLKPQNVLLDAKGNAVLTDFGIAKLLDGDENNTALTQTGMALGTPAYMAPEQWRGRQVDSRVDLYALGIMLYEMIAGRLPFHGDTPPAMMYLHVTEPPPKLKTLRPDVPDAFQTVIETALAKEPDKRYQLAMDLVRAFRQAMNAPHRSASAGPATVVDDDPFTDIFTGSRPVPAPPADDMDDIFSAPASVIAAQPIKRSGNTPSGQRLPEIKIGARTRMYTGPSAQSPVARTLPVGATVELIQQVGEFIEVIWNGYRGFIYGNRDALLGVNVPAAPARPVVEPPPQPAPRMPTPIPGRAIQVITLGAVAMYDGPGYTNRWLRQLPPKSSVEVGRASGEFVEVIWNGYSGWVHNATAVILSFIDRNTNQPASYQTTLRDWLGKRGG